MAYTIHKAELSILGVAGHDFCFDKADKKQQIYILFNMNAQKLFIIQGY